MSDEIICPCGEPAHPWKIHNVSGLSELRARAGDFASFRRALLSPAEDTGAALSTWVPNPRGDLGVQLLEWWAYLADILTFYNERAIENAYLRTARAPGAVERLVRMLGYRPRPGIGAWGVVAAMVNAKVPVTIPAGFSVLSKPSPGKKPQAFEAMHSVEVSPGGAVDVDIVHATLIRDRRSVLVRGTVTGLREGERLLLVKKGWAGQISEHVLVTVQTIAKEKDPRGKTNTRVTFTGDLPGGNVLAEFVTDYRLLRATQKTTVFNSPPDPGGWSVILSNPTRDIAPGDLLLLESSLVVTQSYKDTFHNLQINGQQEFVAATGTVVFAPGPVWVPIGSPVLFAFREVGTLMNEIIPGVTSQSSVEVAPAGAPGFSGKTKFPVLVEDATGRGALGIAVIPGFSFPSVPSGTVVIHFTAPATLVAPLRVFTNLIPVNRGKSVTNEVLGNGDASLAGQSFALAKSPVTYLAAAGPDAPEGYKSTILLRVDGLAWKEVQSFYGQPADAQVFVTHEDEQGITHVTFGDGVNGARLPSGTGNVVASYRHESGAIPPDPGALTVIAKPLPGVQSLKCPVAPWGGSDPDPPSKLRLYGPRSVLTFGRAVSGDDYEAIAARAPAVKRAKVHYSWDGELQRAVATVYVGDDNAAVESATKALAAVVDPNRPLRVLLAKQRTLLIGVRLAIDPRYDQEQIEAGVRAALLDPETGIFGDDVPRLGETFYNSQLYDLCLRVPGTLAVRGLDMRSSIPMLGERHSPGEGSYFHVHPQDLVISLELATDAF